MCAASWSGQMPGGIRLARELGATRNTVESEGLLVARGHGKRRIIAAAGMGANTRALRVVVFLFEDRDRTTHNIVELMHALRNAGHHAEYAPKTQTALRGNVARAARTARPRGPSRDCGSSILHEARAEGSRGSGRTGN